jgi:glucose-1-phosphate cytidylyltransferase
MVEIGGEPIVWHIMKIYASYGINDFVICCGYKGYLIKEYFKNYFLYHADVSFDLGVNTMQVHQNQVEPWRVTLVDTGEETMTGGRLRQVKNYLGQQTFCLTYGDTLSDVDIAASIRYHRKHGNLATLTAVQPPGRFGAFTLKEEYTRIDSFKEKPQGGETPWINGGFFVLEPEVMDYITGEDTIWEKEPLENLAQDGQLSAFRHAGFWQPMDTLRDRQVLEDLWQKNKAPWHIWSPTESMP